MEKLLRAMGRHPDQEHVEQLAERITPENRHPEIGCPLVAPDDPYPATLTPKQIITHVISRIDYASEDDEIADAILAGLEAAGWKFKYVEDEE